MKISINLDNVQRVLDEAAIIAVTDVEGKIIFANDKFCQISKYSREELIGQDYRIVNSHYHPEEFFRDLWKTIAGGRVWRGEIRNRAKDGSVYWADTTIIPILHENGKPFQYLAIHYETTQQKMAEEIIEKLPQRIMQTQEEERNWIAQEIHDDFGQLLIALKIFLVNKTTGLLEKYPEFKEVADELKAKINVIIEKARNLSHELAPPHLKYTGLAQAVRELLESMPWGKDVSVRFLHRNLKKVDFGAKDIVLYRVIQEALTNIMKHAEAKNIEIYMGYRNGKVRLAIKDDGKGFDEKKQAKDNAGLGLSLMRERAKLIGGVLRIKSDDGAGTEIHLVVPVREKSSGQK